MKKISTNTYIITLAISLVVILSLTFFLISGKATENTFFLNLTKSLIPNAIIVLLSIIIGIFAYKIGFSNDSVIQNQLQQLNSRIKQYNFNDLKRSIVLFKKELDKQNFSPKIALSFTRTGNIIASMYSINKDISIKNVFSIQRDEQYRIIEMAKKYNIELIQNKEIVIFYMSINTTKSLFNGLEYFFKQVLKEKTEISHELLKKYKVRICAVYVTSAALQILDKYYENDTLIYSKETDEANKLTESQPWVLDKYDYF